MKFPGAVLVRRYSVVLFALYVVLGTTLAAAQTVILRHALPGSTLELVLDAKQAGTAKADGGGTATVRTTSVDGQVDVNVWLDTCDDVHRVILARSDVLPPTPAGSCRRTQIAGQYLLQRVTSIVIDTNTPTSLMIRQGRAYDSWLTDAHRQVPKAPKAVEGTETRTTASSPASEPLPPLNGLMLFGGAGRGTAANFGSQVCGTVACSRSEPIQYGGGIGWWFNNFFGVEGRYGYLGKVSVAATESDFQFSTTREGGFLAFAGRAGFRKGRFRPFGRAGMSLDRTTLTTTQTVGESTEILAMRTRGWAPVFGAGVEIWLSPRFGLYLDGQRLGLKGKDEGDSGIGVNDTLFTAQVGLTVRLR